MTLANLRNAARFLVRNNGYAKGAIRTITNDVVGWGIKPTAKHDRFMAWARSTDCDVTGRKNFAGLQSLALKSVIADGEVLVRRRWRRADLGLPLPFQLQVMEADFIDTSKHTRLESGNRVVRGVEVNARGRRVAYWLHREHPGSSTHASVGSFYSESVRVPASEILHIFDDERPGQVRGASWFAPILIRFSDFDEFADATLMKQKVAACLTVLTTDVGGSGTRLGADPGDDALDQLEPGLIASVPAGQDVEIVSPPSVREYPDFVHTTLNEIATGIGTTPEDMTGDYSGMNFSSARMSRLRHWGRVNDWRWGILRPQMLDPIWDWGMQAAALVGAGTVENEGWTAPPLPMIEPDKEGLAIIRNIRGGITAPSEALLERGFDPESFWDRYADDFDELDKRGIILDADARQMTQAGQLHVTIGGGGGLENDPDDDDEPTPDDESPDEPDEADEPDDDADEPPRSSASPVTAPMAASSLPNMMTVSEAAERYKISTKTIYKWIADGAIPHARVGPSGKNIRVSGESFDAIDPAT